MVTYRHRKKNHTQTPQVVVVRGWKNRANTSKLTFFRRHSSQARETFERFRGGTVVIDDVETTAEVVSGIVEIAVPEAGVVLVAVEGFVICTIRGVAEGGVGGGCNTKGLSIGDEIKGGLVFVAIYKYNINNIYT